MGKALILVVLVGLGLGFLVPLGQPPAQPAEAVQSAETPKPDRRARRPAPAPTAWATETRLRRDPGGHFLATANVNGQPVEFVVDTGATTVALTLDDARRAGVAVDPSRFEVVGTGAGGALRGQPITIDSVSLDGKEVREIRGAVIEGLPVSLLGQTYLTRIGGVEMSGGEMVLR